MAEIQRAVGRHSTVRAGLPGAHWHVALSCCSLVPAARDHGFKVLRQ